MGRVRLAVGASAIVIAQATRWRAAPVPAAGSVRLACRDRAGYTSPHIAGRIQRGGGTGPMKPRQPFRASGNGANSIRLQQRPGRCGRSFSLGEPSPQARRRFFHMAVREAQVQGMWRRGTRSRRSTSASGASARSRSSTTTRALGDDVARPAPAHPGRGRRTLALRRLPAARRRPARRLQPARLARRACRPAGRR